MQIAQIYIDYLEQVNTTLSTMMLCNEIFVLMDLNKKNRYERKIVIKGVV